MIYTQKSWSNDDSKDTWHPLEYPAMVFYGWMLVCVENRCMKLYEIIQFSEPEIWYGKSLQEVPTLRVAIRQSEASWDVNEVVHNEFLLLDPMIIK